MMDLCCGPTLRLLSICSIRDMTNWLFHNQGLFSRSPSTIYMAFKRSLPPATRWATVLFPGPGF